MTPLLSFPLLLFSPAGGPKRRHCSGARTQLQHHPRPLAHHPHSAASPPSPHWLTTSPPQAPPLPEGLDTSLIDKGQLAYWRLELATMVVS